ncbi:hypothetical protein METBIDRAFT_103207 [Metschnikowia bicuspidata var. bicuspidata NRRL YB-4993]|uniref:Uncharacterized protein n=1 Tax=Metschnikowia bicuspidata var. bicuspidata NRRL YB-4993 TaxID=869754 RepID=A0A1A0HHC0_9ASCO|nr:hypothetical protein METBIDRAFT_103207 [Metschnikowia bicuspidata var. bicuspidata NRRL YB-4993]OBA23272.1 hypothetical protein METBIDRAFT_103207 [Metschnikowia bicuspidata var. bicuspidata NRRL YB-4993]
MEKLPSKVLSPRNRNISQSTGLAKFKLSPKRAHLESTKDACALLYEPPKLSHQFNAELERKASFHRARSVFDGSPLRKCGEKQAEFPDIPGLLSTRPKAKSPFRPSFTVERATGNTIKEQKSVKEPSRNDLLFKYAEKQTKLLELQRQKEVLEFEILEIEAQLQKNIGQDTFAKVHTEPNTLKNKVSTLFQSGPDSSLLRKTASTIFSTNTEISKESTPFFSPKLSAPRQNSPVASLRKTASSIFTPPANFMPNHELKKKASAMLNNKFMNDVRDKIDQQQNEFEEFTKKGTEFARNFITSLSPKKEPEPRESILADSSFSVDNLVNLSIADRSVLLSDDEYEGENILDDSEQSAIHIDDCDSDDSYAADEY